MLYFLLGCKKDCRTYLYKPHEVCETSGENSYKKRKKIKRFHWMFGFLPVLGLGTDAKLDNASV